MAELRCAPLSLVAKRFDLFEIAIDTTALTEDHAGRQRVEFTAPGWHHPCTEI